MNNKSLLRTPVSPVIACRPEELKLLELGKRLRALREAQPDLSQKALAQRCGWGSAQARISQYENDTREPKLHELEIIAAALGISLKDLLFPEAVTAGVTETIANYDTGATHQVFVERFELRPSTGQPGSSWQLLPHAPMLLDRSLIEKRGLNPTNLRALHAPDDSMRPYITAADSIVVDTSDNASPKDNEVYALRWDQGPEWRIRRIYKQPDGGLLLHPDNPAVREVPVAAEHIKNVEIYGRVVWRGG